jgi:NAD(P)-dependent dehydrogenase (short-subunit alcohol dehydrogenase family)
MKDRVVLLTGATAGIGREAASQIARLGATLVCVGRDEDKARLLVDELRSASGNDRISSLIGDLSRPGEVQQVAVQFKEQHDRLDVLFNNAGAMFDRRQLTEDGLERTFALNHLGYFVMTQLLLDKLEAAPAGRVVSTSSGAHGKGDLAYLDDLQTERYGLSGMKAYGRSKLANIWFTRELAKRLEGTQVTATCFHPGFVASDFGYNNSLFFKLVLTMSKPFQKTVAQGADTGVWLATSGETAGETGSYWIHRKRRKGSPAARDDQAPARLWSQSEAIVARLLGDDWATAPA